MNTDTGEIITFDSKEAYEKFIKAADNRFVPVNLEDLTPEEMDGKKVKDPSIKNLLIEIAEARDKPRGVRRRLEKKLQKLRKRG